VITEGRFVNGFYIKELQILINLSKSTEGGCIFLDIYASSCYKKVSKISGISKVYSAGSFSGFLANIEQARCFVKVLLLVSLKVVLDKRRVM
jgi:hypothetical protein